MKGIYWLQFQNVLSFFLRYWRKLFFFNVFYWYIIERKEDKGGEEDLNKNILN